MFRELRIWNFGPIGHATIQLAGQGLVYVVGRNEDTTAASSNGSGKTHIWKALSWCLFGMTVDGETPDELVHREADTMSVATDIVRDGKIWTVRRGRAKKAPRLELLLDGVEIDLGKAELAEKVAEIVFFDWQGFKNSILFGQGDIDRYAARRTTDAARKDMLHNILGTERLKAAAKKIRAEASEVEKKIAELETNAAQNEARLGELDLDKLRIDRDSFEERRDEKLEKLLGRLGQARGKFDELTAEAVAGRVEFDEKIAETEELLAAFDETGDRIAKLTEEIRGADGEALAMDPRITWIEAEAHQLTEQLDQLAGDECPTCSGPLSAEPAEVKKRELEARIAEREKQSEAIHRKLGKAQARAKGYRIELDKAEKTKADVDELARELVELKEDRESFDSLDVEAEMYKSRARELLEQYEAAEAEANPFVELAAGAEMKVRRYETRISVAQRALGLRRDELLHLKWWERGFGWKGLPAYMLDAVMPVLTEHANRYLSILADGDLKVEFSSRRQLKSGDFRDELSIKIWNEGFEGTVPSGGQQRKIEIATDLALMKVVAMKGEVSPGILILDEALDGLDPEGRERVIKLLEALTNEISSIFVIDHWGGYEHAFDRTLEAVKLDGFMSIWEG